MVAIRGHFDGTVFAPDGPVDLPKHQPVILHVETPASKQASDIWEVLSDGTGSIEAPSDWSARHDHYLYGAPKRPADRQP